MNRFFRIPLLVLVGLGLSGCWGDSETWHQKVKVVVQTPAGEVSGEAVSSGFIKDLSGMERLGSGNVVGGRIDKGEAVVVDLGDGRYLFALLGPGDDTWYLPFRTLLNGFPAAYSEPGTTYTDAAHAFKAVKGPRDIPSNYYPMLVTFGDIKHPKSVLKVDPHNLAASFGAGYSLKSITLEITDEPVTEGKVVAALPWIKGWHTAFVPSKLKPANQYTFPETMSPSYFFSGVSP